MTITLSLSTINAFLSNLHFLLGIQTIAFLFKIALLHFFILRIYKTKSVSPIWTYLLLVIATTALEDFSWIASLSSKTELLAIPGPVVLFIVRLGWAANAITYQALSLFIGSFSQKNHKLVFYNYIFIPITSVFFFFFLGMAIKGGAQFPFEKIMQQYESYYALLILMPFTILVAFISLRHSSLPRILQYQLRTVINFLLIPHLIANLWQVYPFTFLMQSLANNLPAVAISAIFLTSTLFYFVRRIIGLRFLNIHNHVHGNDPHKFNFVNDFKNTLEDLGNTSSTNEIKLIVQHFFTKAFKIPATCISVFIRPVHSIMPSDENSQPIILQKEIAIENFIGTTSSIQNAITNTLDMLKTTRILTRDEIEYNNMYEQTEERNTALLFLDSINADIFLPIYEDGRIVACIVIEKGARTEQLYTDIERDEMLVFASYVSKIINLLQNRNLNELLKQRKDVVEELYLKHQEINQYKESIRSFLRINKENNFGILFYKNKKFSFGNKNASEILGINPNTQEGDPLTKSLKTLAHQVEVYKTTQTTMIKDAFGKKLVVTALPHPDSNAVILTIHLPEISDIVKQLLDHVKDPSNWDYLLYLETTESGKLINTLVPGTGEILLNFKIDLLKLSLSKKAILLELANDDLLPTVEMIHHINLKETLYTLDIQSPASGHDIPIKLFGINPIFGSSTSQPLLERLNKRGTLFIKNIHFVDKETQELLAEFIRYGFYKVFKSEKKVQSDVRIICSTNQNLYQLVQKGIFSQTLYNELRKTSLTLPSLMTLPQDELEMLVEGFSEQALATENCVPNLLSLSDKDKEKIITQKPISLHELKCRVQNILVHKTKKSEAFYDTQFDPAYNISDPKLIEASRLGKYALKDPKIMTLLWDKFKSQSKIALFLGVNRSSVNRRCKDYGLL